MCYRLAPASSFPICFGNPNSALSTLSLPMQQCSVELRVSPNLSSWVLSTLVDPLRCAEQIVTSFLPVRMVFPLFVGVFELDHPQRNLCLPSTSHTPPTHYPQSGDPLRRYIERTQPLSFPSLNACFFFHVTVIVIAPPMASPNHRWTIPFPISRSPCRLKAQALQPPTFSQKAPICANSLPPPDPL